jgi:hypothetical protein
MPEEDYTNQDQDMQGNNPEYPGENIDDGQDELKKEADTAGNIRDVDVEESKKDEQEMQEEFENDTRRQLTEKQAEEDQENQGDKLSDTVGNITDIAKDQLKKKGWQIVLRSPYFWGAIAIILLVLMFIGFIYILAADPCFSLKLFGFSLSGAACDAVQSLTS